METGQGNIVLDIEESRGSREYFYLFFFPSINKIQFVMVIKWDSLVSAWRMSIGHGLHRWPNQQVQVEKKKSSLRHRTKVSLVFAMVYNMEGSFLLVI